MASLDSTQVDFLSPAYRLWPYNILAAPNPVVTGTGAIIPNATGRGINMFVGGKGGAGTCSIRAHASSQNQSTSSLRIEKVRRIDLQLRGPSSQANQDTYVYVTEENSDVAPSPTARHFGIYWHGAGLPNTFTGVFTTADGTTEQTTDIQPLMDLGQDLGLVIMFNGGVTQLFNAGVLLATHTLNVPSTPGGIAILRCYLSTISAFGNADMDIEGSNITFAV